MGMIITPSILTNTVEDAVRQIERLSPFFNYFQIDIADGKFVQNTTLSVEDFSEYVKSNPRHPVISQSFFDFHLMVVDYGKDLEILAELSNTIKIKTVFIHIKLRPDYSNLKQKYSKFVIGLVFNPDDDVQIYSSIYPYKEVDMVQIMSVSPGMQGLPFIEESLHKSEQLKSNGYRNKIFLDGGINAKTLPAILNTVPPIDGIGPGSYLSKAENIGQRVKELKDLCIKAGNSPILKVT
jgi:pentose-5-phosphate-3-epimerase